MSGWRAIRLVARREIRERLRAREFQAATAVLVLAVVGIVVVAGVTSDEGRETYEAGAADASGAAILAAAEAQQAAFGVELESRRLPGRAAAVAAVADEEVDTAIAGNRLFVGSDPSEPLVALVQAATREVRGVELLREEGLSGAAIERTLDPPDLAVREVGEGEAGEGLAFLTGLLLYGAIIMSGLAVASGVVVEKGSRVVELLLVSIEPVQLLAGKVLGLGLVGLLQVLAVAGSGIAAALLGDAIDLPQSTAATTALVGLCFVFGYTLYACAFAVAGAIVSRQEDLQGGSTVITFALVAALLASLAAASEPSSTFAVVCTFLPPVAPLVVPARAAQGALPAWELALSIALMAGAVVLLVWLAARIYERAVLRMGSPLKLRQALRLAR